jgi:hypothetical protein
MKAVLPLKCIKSFVTMPSKDKYAHLPKLLSFTNMTDGREWGHPRKEELRPKLKEKRQEPVQDQETGTQVS